MRFADRGNVLRKMHLAETILEADGFDLHTDGTSRSDRCYVGNQATISTGLVMSFGYSMVVTEDTETLLDLATRLLMELSDVYTADDGDQQLIYKNLLRKMISLMSDRASVMKSFNTAMNRNRNETLGLGDDEQLQYLYCNAHFLLGLSSEAEKALKELQKPLGKLGRDTLAVFKSFSGAGESAVARVIRTGCDVLGPRGDEKNGCRSAWEAYCEMKEMSSHIFQKLSIMAFF
jgi:aubergine-like protein